MKDIGEALKERRSMILRLQAELEVLERARSLLNGESPDVAPLAIVVREQVSVRDGRRVRRATSVHPMKGKVNPKSSVGHALAVLREGGVPLHIKEIMARMKQRGAEPKKTSLFSTMTRLSKRGHIFYKADQPSTFGLVEGQKAKATATA